MKNVKNNKCNMEDLVSGTCESAAYFKPCGKQAIWSNERWPTAIVCEDHKAKLEEVFPDNWILIGGR